MASAASPFLSVQREARDFKLNGLRKRFIEDVQKRNNLGVSRQQKEELQAALERYNPAHASDPTPLVKPGPDIEWNPSLETYLLRIRRLAKLGESPPTKLPSGFPNTIASGRVWTGADFEDEKRYVVILSADDVNEIEDALVFFHALGDYTSPDQVTKETFPLPSLGKRLDALSHELHTGQGFYVLRGLDPTRYSALDNVLIYVGVTSYIGVIRGCQDADGNKLIHVKDRGSDLPSATLRQSPYANHAQPFHTDGCDLLAMYVLDTAAQGGTSKIASSAKIYNEIAATRPDVIQTLSDSSWVFDKHEKAPFWRVRPILLNFGPFHGPSFCYSRRPITGSPSSPRSPGVPPMTERQAEALDMVHFTAQAHALYIPLQRGDIQLLNNLAAFHARDAFIDDTTPGGHQRHMLRLWLRNEERAWPTPAPLQRTWYQTYSRNSERATRATWSILPTATRERVLSRKDSCA